MSLFRQAQFHTTIADLSALPEDTLREVAFAGRSNAGKSSAINTLTDQTRLAFVSKMPGRTQHLNFFTLEAGKYLVDLPGYGYAKTPEAVRDAWEGLLAPYLRERLPLVGLVLIMDCRHPLTDLDIQMLEWFGETQKPIHILLSKADKLSRQEQMKVLTHTRAALTHYGEQCTVQLFSSLKRTGVNEALTRLSAWLDLPKEAAAQQAPPAPTHAGKKPRPKNRTAKGWSARIHAKKT